MPFIKKLRPAFYFTSLICLLSIFNSANTAHAVLPDSGQTKCYNNTGEIPCPAPGDAFYGQDGNYQGPQPAYQVSADGLVVSDLNTGLMWQQGDDGVKRDLADAVTYCENLLIGGHSDWRIPAYQELLSIVDYSRDTPVINPLFRCSSDYYWSGSEYAGYPTLFWSVFFGSGYSRTDPRATSYRVRCVRGGLNLGPYVDNGDGTVSDTSTGLMWQQADNRPMGMPKWKDALSYCEALEFGGKTDWRLPNIRELLSILDTGRFSPAINPAFNCQNDYYWSGTTTMFFGNLGSAYVVHFGKGIETFSNKNENRWTRCVRDGASELIALDILYPDGGEVLVKGENFNITWNSQNVTGTIQIDLYKGGRTSQQFLRQIAVAAPNTGSYPFTPPDDIPEGSDYLIRISAHGGSLWDFSNSFFSTSGKNISKSMPWLHLLLE